MRGRFNSSITRVRPFFMALLVRDASARTWLPDLLEAAPRADILDDDVRRHPGRLFHELVQPRDYLDRVLGRTLALPRCFEHSAPPSRAFLRWMIENPQRMRWPERKPGVPPPSLNTEGVAVGARSLAVQSRVHFLL
jgi:hypothetical protein